MPTELRTDSWHRYMMYRSDERHTSFADDDEGRKAVEKGCKFVASAYVEVWADNEELVQRVREFLGANFHWHGRLAQFGLSREVIETLMSMVRGGSVVVLPEKSPNGGSGRAWPPRKAASSSFWGVDNYDKTPYVSVGARYRAQLERIESERTTWVEAQAMMDDINAGFMQKLAGSSPLLDSLFEAAGWADKYANAADTGSSLLGDAQPFEYGDGLSSDDSSLMQLAGRLTPNTGLSGAWYTNPGSGQMRLFGGNGNPVVDFDFDHNHGQGIPHAHNWDDVGGDYPVRGPGVRFSLLP